MHSFCSASRWMTIQQWRAVLAFAISRFFAPPPLCLTAFSSSAGALEWPCVGTLEYLPILSILWGRCFFSGSLLLCVRNVQRSCTLIVDGNVRTVCTFPVAVFRFLWPQAQSKHSRAAVYARRRAVWLVRLCGAGGLHVASTLGRLHDGRWRRVGGHAPVVVLLLRRHDERCPGAAAPAAAVRRLAAPGERRRV